MSDGIPKRSVGRPPKSNVNITKSDKWVEMGSSQEAAQAITYAKEKAREDYIKKGKKSIKVIGYEYRPYYNRPKKHHLAKIILVEKNCLRNIILRRLIARNVPIEEAQKLMTIRDETLLQKEHKKRDKQANYGFGY